MLGIDVSKAELACTLVRPSDQEVLWRRSVPNSPEGVQALLSLAPAGAPWVMEPTGRYSLSVAEPAVKAGRNVLLAPPRRARRFLESRGSRAKTDPLDSLGLALFALAQRPSEPLPAYPIKNEAVQELDQLLSARKGLATSITRLTLQRAELAYAREHLDRAIRELKAERKRLDQKIAALTADKQVWPHVERLKAVPGIGPVTSAALASRLAARSFTHSDQFVAYIGLDVAVSQSGAKKGDKGLTRQGDAELRRLLFNAARAATCTKGAQGSPFREQYERELKKGLPKTAAHCAVARKLARLCWSLVRHNQEYDPLRVHTQPKKERTGSKSREGLDNKA